MEIRKISFDIHGDERGSLVAIEGEPTIPFDIKRVYYIWGTQAGVVRGNHAHRNLQQVLICTSGSCVVTVDDGVDRVDVPLNDPTQGLYIGPMWWREMKDFSDDAVLLVLASEIYSESDYIRDYPTFKRMATDRR